MVDNRALEQVHLLINPEHFYDPLHARIFENMVQVFQGGSIVLTPLTLHAAIKADPGLVEMGGMAYLANLVAAAPALPNVRDFARILHDLAIRRELIRIGEDIVNTVYDAPTERSTGKQIEDAANALKAIADIESEHSPQILPFIDVRAWEGIAAPPREWAVQDRIPARCVTLLSGEGSVGKTLLAEQLAVATTVVKDWLGVVPKPGPAMIVCCEDDADEMHRRFQRIAEYYGSSFSDLADLHPLSLVGRNATFAAPNRAGIIEPTPLFGQVLRAAKSIKPSILILDNSADIFAGNENDRSQVRRFITLLTEIALEADCAVLLTSHPSLAGTANGSGISGSTAWHASVRARLYMRKPKAEGDDQADPDERVLEVMKSNYGPPGESIGLRWQNGLFVPTDDVHWIDKRAAASVAEALFLSLLQRFERQDRNVSDKPTAPNYAPTMFAREPEAKEKRLKKAAFTSAMGALFNAGKIHLETYGRAARPAQKLAVGPRP